MAKKILYQDNARRALERGMEIMVEAVSITLGPKGRNVVLEKTYGSPQIVNDGVTIAKEIKLEDHIENTGVSLIRQAAAKTNDVINECLGGVLFIDEAYSLGNAEKRDSFSKECIDTLCEALSNHKDKLMVIIAGYESELKECFFAYNQGLESRFTWRFKTGQYNGKELYDIFLKKVASIGWTMDESINDKWFEKNAVYFKFYGRDIETVLSKAKIAHSRRIFSKSSDNQKMLSKKDLEKGFENFLKIEEVKKRKEEHDYSRNLGMLYL